MCVCVVCVCVLGRGYMCVWERERNRNWHRDRKKETENHRDRERQRLFFLPGKNHRYIFQLPQKKDPIQKHLFKNSSLICTFLKEKDVQLAPCSVGGVSQAPPLQWMLKAGMVASPRCSCFSCSSEWVPRASQVWCRGSRTEQDQDGAKHHHAPQNSVWWTYLQGRNRPTDIENKFMVTHGERDGRDKLAYTYIQNKQGATV